MADTMRTSSFMPTIKCSMCSREIEISMMGEHICSGSMPEPTPPLDAYGNFHDRAPYNQRPPGAVSLRTGRGAPPKVDTTAANRTYLRSDQLSPVSASSESRSISPRTPQDMPRSPYRQISPPSPEDLHTNIDAAFPPFPSKKKLSPALQGSFFAKDNRPPADSGIARKSPALQGAGQLLQRMNSIAPGPFDHRSNRLPTRGASRSGQKTLQPAASIRSRENSHTYTNSSVSSNSRLSSTSSSGLARSLPSGYPRLEKKGTYDGFGPPASRDGKTSPALQQNFARSQTYPQQQTDTRNAADRRPVQASSNSETNYGDYGSMTASPEGMREQRGVSAESGRLFAESNYSSNRQDFLQPDSYVLSSASSIGADYDVGNPYHTPNMSQSSSSSGRSGTNSGVSSRSSPPSVMGQGRRQISDTSELEALMKSLQTTMPTSQTTSKSPPPQGYRPQSPQRQPQARRPSPERPHMVGQYRPTDTATQSGRLSPPVSRELYASRDVPSRNGARSPPVTHAEVFPARAPSPAVKRPATSKGNCKGCKIAITGKSVSSADGRLTGRYHKDCFVCMTCSEPFSTATFYVIDDQPYCERHYHKLNGSMCQTCDRGIEGQYLETERKTKHHPHCLACSDCKRVLTDDYYEMGTRIYCERDALRRSNQRNMLGVGGQTSRMERRTTRLMMI